MTTGHPPARLRADHQDAVLTSADIAFIRATLAACTQVLAWAAENGDEQTRGKIADATQVAHGNRSPAGLAYYASLAIDRLDFAPAARPRKTGGLKLRQGNLHLRLQARVGSAVCFAAEGAVWQMP